MKKILIINLIMLSLIVPKITKAVVTSSSISNDLKVYLYYSDNCSKCTEEKELIESLTSEYPRISLEYLSVNEIPEKLKEILKIKVEKTPILIIGSTVFNDYNKNINKEINDALKSYSASSNICDIMTKLDNLEEAKTCIEENKKIYSKHTNSIFTIGISSILIIVIIGAFLLKSKKRNIEGDN